MNDDFAAAWAEYVGTPIESYIAHCRTQRRIPHREMFAGLAERTSAYRQFLAEHGLTVGTAFDPSNVDRLPATTKQNYVQRYPISERCLDGGLGFTDTMSVSSGTTGTAVMWPRSLADEARSAYTFEAIFNRSFRAHERRTLALICFPLGIWVGGMHTFSTLRLLSLKGYPITALAPGVNLAEIRRCLTEVAPLFEQTVICGYPPFIKDFLSEMVPAEVDPLKIRMKLLLAGEAISEPWREDMAQRLAFDDSTADCISMYGTADAGPIAFETAATIQMRRRLAEAPNLAEGLFGSTSLPSIFQYLPGRLFFEKKTETVTMWVQGTHTHFKYDINDVGTAMDGAELPGEYGMEAGDLPLVYHFGRKDHTVSFFGGNVYPEHVASLLDRTEYQSHLTGRFTLLVLQASGENKPLEVVVESRAGVDHSAAFADSLADALQAHLLTVNSEYANYVPAKYQRPNVVIAEFHDSRYFQRGKKQSYIQRD